MDSIVHGSELPSSRGQPKRIFQPSNGAVSSSAGRLSARSSMGSPFATPMTSPAGDGAGLIDFSTTASSYALRPVHTGRLVSTTAPGEHVPPATSGDLTRLSRRGSNASATHPRVPLLRPVSFGDTPEGAAALSSRSRRSSVSSDGGSGVLLKSASSQPSLWASAAASPAQSASARLLLQRPPPHLPRPASQHMRGAYTGNEESENDLSVIQHDAGRVSGAGAPGVHMDYSFDASGDYGTEKAPVPGTDASSSRFVVQSHVSLSGGALGPPPPSPSSGWLSGRSGGGGTMSPSSVAHGSSASAPPMGVVATGAMGGAAPPIGPPQAQGRGKGRAGPTYPRYAGVAQPAPATVSVPAQGAPAAEDRFGVGIAQRSPMEAPPFPPFSLEKEEEQTRQRATAPAQAPATSLFFKDVENTGIAGGASTMSIFARPAPQPKYARVKATEATAGALFGGATLTQASSSHSDGAASLGHPPRVLAVTREVADTGALFSPKDGVDKASEKDALTAQLAAMGIAVRSAPSFAFSALSSSADAEGPGGLALGPQQGHTRGQTGSNTDQFRSTPSTTALFANMEGTEAGAALFAAVAMKGSGARQDKSGGLHGRHASALSNADDLFGAVAWSEGGQAQRTAGAALEAASGVAKAPETAYSTHSYEAEFSSLQEIDPTYAEWNVQHSEGMLAAPAASSTTTYPAAYSAPPWMTQPQPGSVKVGTSPLDMAGSAPVVQASAGQTLAAPARGVCVSPWEVGAGHVAGPANASQGVAPLQQVEQPPAWASGIGSGTSTSRSGVPVGFDPAAYSAARKSGGQGISPVPAPPAKSAPFALPPIAPPTGPAAAGAGAAFTPGPGGAASQLHQPWSQGIGIASVPVSADAEASRQDLAKKKSSIAPVSARRPRFAVFQPQPGATHANGFEGDQEASTNGSQVSKEYAPESFIPRTHTSSAGGFGSNAVTDGMTGTMRGAPHDLRTTRRALASFGFGRLVVIHPNRSSVSIMDGSSLFEQDHMHEPRMAPDVALLREWKGPFVAAGQAQAQSDEVLKHVHKLDEIERVSGSPREEGRGGHGADVKLLHDVLRLLIEKGGVLNLSAPSSGGRWDRSEAPAAALARVILGAYVAEPEISPNTGLRDECSGRGDTVALAAVEKSVCSGDRASGLQASVSAGLWTHALLIAATLDKEAYSRTVAAYTAACVHPRSPLAVLYPALAGDSSAMMRALGLHAGNNGSSGSSAGEPYSVIDVAQPGAWRAHVAALLSNRVMTDPRALMAVGDRLWRATQSVHAAHALYIAAGHSVDPWSPRGAVTADASSSPTRMHSIGFDHTAAMQVGVGIGGDIPSLLRTEVYEYARKVGSGQAAVPAAQSAKLLLAHAFVDAGLLLAASRYVSSARGGVKEVLGSSYAGPGSGTSAGYGTGVIPSVVVINGVPCIGPFPVAMLLDLDALDDRLNGSGRAGANTKSVFAGASGVAGVAAAAMGSALSGLARLLIAPASESERASEVAGVTGPQAQQTLKGGSAPGTTGAENGHGYVSRRGSEGYSGQPHQQVHGQGGASSTPAKAQAPPATAAVTDGMSTPAPLPSAANGGGGLFAGFRSIFRGKAADPSAAPTGPRVAKLDEEGGPGSKPYFDNALSRWVFPGETEEESAPLAPPPVVGVAGASSIPAGTGSTDQAHTPASVPTELVYSAAARAGGKASRINRYVSSTPSVSGEASRPTPVPSAHVGFNPGHGAAGGTPAPSSRPHFAVFSPPPPPPPPTALVAAPEPAMSAGIGIPSAQSALTQASAVGEAEATTTGIDAAYVGDADGAGGAAFGADTADDAAAFFSSDWATSPEQIPVPVASGGGGVGAGPVAGTFPTVAGKQAAVLGPSGLAISGRGLAPVPASSSAPSNISSSPWAGAGASSSSAAGRTTLSDAEASWF